MLEIRLSDEDRERIGCPEWVEMDIGQLSMEEGRALEAEGLSYGIFGTTTVEGYKATVWICLRRIGIEVDYEGLTFNLQAPVRDTGKGRANSTPSTTGTRSASGSSRTGRARRKTN